MRNSKDEQAEQANAGPPGAPAPNVNLRAISNSMDVPEPRASAGNGGAGEKKKIRKKVVLRKNPAKMRVRLPPIESYERELEFPADAPGRVVVRLERLMGTDRVRITDSKYMSTLLKRLEEDEQVQWLKRSKLRRQAERNRYRQLAIEGHMEPGPDMQDLYDHPVFRVNRILNRLSKLDEEISGATGIQKPPPLTPVEPFEEYERTGILFGFHPGHYKLTAEEEPETEAEEEPQEEVNEIYAAKFKRAAARRASRTSLGVSALESTADVPPLPPAPAPLPVRLSLQPKQKPKLQARNEWGGEDYGGEEEEEHEEEAAAAPETNLQQLQKDILADENEEDEDEGTGEEVQVPHEAGEGEGEGEEAEDSEMCETELLRKISLGTLQKQYGIRRNVDLAKAWSPYRSPLVEPIYEEEHESAREMFSMARELLDTYKREVKCAEAFYLKYNRMFR